MAEQLQNVVRLAGSIADGDYSRTLVPQSPHDELSIALESMTTSLRLAAEAEAAHQRQLEEKNLALKHQAAELESFAYVASHDLQEPLRKVQAFADLATKRIGSDLDETTADYLDRMLGAVGRMRALISDLLVYSRCGRTKLGIVEVDLGGLVRRTISDLEIAIDESEASIDVGELPTIEADPRLMGQLFQNLLSNALKYRREEVAPVIRIGPLEVDPETARPEGLADSVTLVGVEVKDNGIGFEDKFSERIFAPFQRLHARHEFPGTGIGLALCQRIVQRHQGLLSATGVPGEGATFRVVLPTEQATAANQEQT